MSLLSWNCRGLGNPRTVRVLHHLVKEKKPEIVFLIETLCRSSTMEKVRCKLGFKGLFVVNPVGRSGGLALLWSENLSVEIFNYSRQHINAIISDEDGRPGWKFTGFYGFPNAARRWESWELLRFLKSFQPSAWLCAGDFNEILDQSEKQGAVLRRSSQIDQFRRALEDCELSDLGFSGPRYTWCNNRRDDNFILERLDRAIANMEWCSRFNFVRVQVLEAICSDHNPILILFKDEPYEIRPSRRAFKFEAKWQLDPECNDISKAAWEQETLEPNKLKDVQVRLSACQRDLARWSSAKFGRDAELLKQKSRRLLELQGANNPCLIEEINQAQKDIDQILEREDFKWKQRAKQNWYSNGDRNTKFFHAWANHRRKINTIRSISDDQGRIWRRRQDIGRVFVNYFEDIFSSSCDTNADLSQCLENVEHLVSDEMNSSLLRPFTAEEVGLALSQMHPLKSPGPDGFSAGFFQKAWCFVGEKVSEAVLSFLNGGPFDPSINATNICLIPKNSAPESVKDYRPISLCNVVYKLISKVLANRMKLVLPQIISPEQSAFIPGRLITDNIIVAFETLHTMATRLKGRNGCMAIKLDMSKAYDRLEWGFLEAVMRRLGFAERWVLLIMTCVRTVSYTVLINGLPHGHIAPSRGIRQGDPLSPFLFILCAEALSRMLDQAAGMGKISGVPIRRGGIRINHLLFADDSILFGKANLDEWRHMKNILEVYERASGQKVNLEKTSIYFSNNTKEEERTSILQETGLIPTQCYESYLGLPTFVGRSRIATFNYIKSRIWNRMNGWKEKFLSHAGKEVLIKAVLQAIPTYTMSVFRLPISLCRDINRLLSKFWWGHMEKVDRMVWMAWKGLGRSKSSGGLGFRDLESFNLALLAKQGWRIIQNPSSLAARVLKEKYFPGGSLFEAPLGYRPSYLWRSICLAKPLLQEGVIWKVGDGTKINIWGDRWIFSPHLNSIQSPIRILNKDAKVSEIIDQNSRWWNIPLIEQIFPAETAEKICSLAISPGTVQDRLIWAYTANGIFTVRSAYHLELDRKARYQGGSSLGPHQSPMWKIIWKLRVPRVTHLFLWRACNNILPTKENLHRRKIVTDPLCPICGREVESAAHSLWNCDAARAVWSEASRAIQKCAINDSDFFRIFCELYERLEIEDLELAAMIAQRLWHRRNQWVFENKFMPPKCLLDGAEDSMKNFKEIQAFPSISGSRAPAPSVSWNPPNVDTVKINWDAAIDKRKNLMGVGIIVRNNFGAVLATQCAVQKFILDPSVAEAIGAKLGADLGRFLGLDSIVLEGDASEVVSALNREEEGFSRMGSIIVEARKVLRDFSVWKVASVRRNCNNAAHQLAKLAVRQNLSQIWMYSYPSCISEIVLKERLLSPD